MPSPLQTQLPPLLPRIPLHPVSHRGQPFRQIPVPKSDTQAILRDRAEFRVVDAGGQEQDASLFDEPLGERLHPVRAVVPDETDAAAVRLPSD